MNWKRQWKFCWEKETPKEEILNKDDVTKHAETLKKFIYAVDLEAGNNITRIECFCCKVKMSNNNYTTDANSWLI
jgi:hypothetical protein